MGLAEQALEHVVRDAKMLPLLFTALLGAWLVFCVVQVLWQNYKLSRIGVRCSQIPTKYPLSIDFIYQSVLATMRYENLELWRHLYAAAGSYTCETRIIGRRVVFTSDPENIKAILATQFDDYGKGEPFHREWKPFLGDSIFTTDGPQWHASRHLIRPQFVKDRISDLDCFETHMGTLFRAMANGGPLRGENQPVDVEAGRGKVLDISDLFFRYTLDVATDFLLGLDVKSLSTPRQPFAEAFGEVQRVQNIISRAGPLALLVPRRSFNQSMKVIDDLLNRYIDRALQLTPSELESKTKSDKGYTFLHALAGFTRERKVLHDQLMAVLLAGRDTTAATLSWTVFELARHPQVVARLRAEILDVVGPTRTPTYADLKSMRYLQAVMNEVLRLYPVVPFNVRLALRDTTLPRGGGPDGTRPVAILKDTPIGYSTLVMQRRADLFPATLKRAAADNDRADDGGEKNDNNDEEEPFDVEAFKPERWMRWQPRPWLYVPFNGGPRICIGQQFALTEMGYVLTRMFQRFGRVESHMPAGPPTLKAEIVLQPGDGVRVAFFEAPLAGPGAAAAEEGRSA